MRSGTVRAKFSTGQSGAPLANNTGGWGKAAQKGHNRAEERILV